MTGLGGVPGLALPHSGPAALGNAVAGWSGSKCTSPDVLDLLDPLDEFVRVALGAGWTNALLLSPGKGVPVEERDTLGMDDQQKRHAGRRI